MFNMADELPRDSKVKIREIVQIEIDTTALIQEANGITEFQDELNLVTSKVKKMFISLRRKLDELKQIGEEEDRESNHLRIKEEVKKHCQNLSTMQVNLRKAVAIAQSSIEKYEKNQLITGEREQHSGVRQRQQSKEGLARTASNITENLMSISKMMEHQVQQSRNNTEALMMSSKGITDTDEELKGLSGFIHTSKQLLNKYNRRENTDKLLIFFGLVLFFCTVLYIIKKRIFSSSA
ncbi:vesicle transport protein SEC20-like [Xenia sp. Carnegie-2017]|uniref:vesicle transport protein SEC20-like n=1 Tax=Xenia sp. Carnegie-2017 TaxID=2897299 RepID=UPI001F0446B6|nr:vesicle transport protein SEC20-like [Xenia sp. Carnegie-2017]